MTTKRNTRKTENKKVDFSDTFTSIKDTANEVIEDVMENSQAIADKAIKPVKSVYTNTYKSVADAVTAKAIIKTTKKVNNYALEIAYEIVDDLAVTSEKWHNVVEKAVKGGLKLASKQQDIVFDTLETLKGQFSKNGARLKKLFSNN